MITAKEYQTRTEFKPLNSPSVEGVTIIATDIGYSGVKTYCESGVFCTPYYAKDLGINPEMLSGSLSPEEILYRDAETKHIWRVGKTAQALVSQSDTNDCDGELVSRYRYHTTMFRISLETAIGLALIHNGYREPKDLNGTIAIQTGLPPAYIEEDTELIKDAFVGKHRFSLKVSETGQYVQFDFELTSGCVDVMSQPKGTLMNLMVDDNGNLDSLIKTFSENGAILDIGYGTLDFFEITERSISNKESFTKFSMNSVLKKTSEKIKEKFGVKLRASAMQNCLETGKVRVCKRVKGRPPVIKSEDFTDLLQEASREICAEAMEQVTNTFDFSNYKYIVITGGTAAAWESYIREYFAEMDIILIRGDENTNIGMTYSNVRGYYFNQLTAQRKRKARCA